MTTAQDAAGPASARPAVHLVCLTFDFDAFSPKLSAGASDPVVLSQGEFSAVGAVRILDTLAEHRILTTFFVPGHTIETYPEITRRIHADGHEIGHHGYLHEAPSGLTRADEEAALIRGTECIRTVTGAAPRGYRAPSWSMSASTIELLIQQGFEYDSSLMAADYHPYRVRTGDVYPHDGPVRFGQESSLLEMPVHWSLDDVPHFEFVRREHFAMQGLMRTDDVLGTWLDEFRYMRSAHDHGILTYTMHPEVMGRGHRMLMLERMIDGLAELGARFVRMDSAMETGRAWLADR